MMNIAMGRGRINTTRSNPDSHNYRIERWQKKRAKLSNSVKLTLDCTPSRQKKAKQEGKLPTDTIIPEVVIQKGDGS